MSIYTPIPPYKRCTCKVYKSQFIREDLHVMNKNKNANPAPKQRNEQQHISKIKSAPRTWRKCVVQFFLLCLHVI